MLDQTTCFLTMQLTTLLQWRQNLWIFNAQVSSLHFGILSTSLPCQFHLRVSSQTTKHSLKGSHITCLVPFILMNVSQVPGLTGISPHPAELHQAYSKHILYKAKHQPLCPDGVPSYRRSHRDHLWSWEPWSWPNTQAEKDKEWGGGLCFLRNIWKYSQHRITNWMNMILL